MKSLIFIFSLFSLIYGNIVLIEPTRLRRGILGTVTSTVFTTVTETHYVPATCLHVDPNLPDCRNVRFLNLPAFNGFNYFNFTNSLGSGNNVPGKGNSTNNDHQTVEITKRADLDQNPDQTVHIQGWAEYLGLTRPTVTVTDVKIVPTTVLDPRIVVTYAIKGCKPHSLPYNLEKCPEEPEVEMIEIVPTTTVYARMESTAEPEKSTFSAQGVLESTEVERVDETVQHKKATKKLH
ncbi:uncharacterized protein LOC115877306 [Sitophilus oryzae]|uniref:Uncharacterized protein LOC115877306 n=1 Tax=Sitophilus oryzae TaxID=7048 RepID=A0A6J2XED3_SITOR|nr:uncharacterized protein LOC115877306 [Sitophilus oryzae]